MTVAWEAAHVGAQLGDDHLGGALGDARNRAQKLTLALERAHALLDLCRERADRLIQVLDVRKQMGDQQRVVVAKAPLQRLAQQRQLRAQLAFGQIRELGGIRGARDQRLDHALSGDAEDLTGH